MTKKKTTPSTNDHGQRRLFWVPSERAFIFLDGRLDTLGENMLYKYQGFWRRFSNLTAKGFVRFPMRRFVRLTSTSDQKIGTHVQLPFYAAQQKAWYGGGWMGLRELRMVHKLADAPEIKQLPGKGASEFYKAAPMGAQIQRPKRKK